MPVFSLPMKSRNFLYKKTDHIDQFSITKYAFKLFLNMSFLSSSYKFFAGQDTIQTSQKHCAAKQYDSI